MAATHVHRQRVPKARNALPRASHPPLPQHAGVSLARLPRGKDLGVPHAVKHTSGRRARLREWSATARLTLADCREGKHSVLPKQAELSTGRGPECRSATTEVGICKEMKTDVL